jgi:hypothetical protein
MEEKPPTQGRDVPRSRTPRATFSTPDQPTPPSKPAERAPRRAVKPAPPVTFRPPASSDDAEDHQDRKPEPPQKPVSGTDTPAPTTTPGPEQHLQPPRSPRKSAPRKAQPTAAQAPAPAKPAKAASPRKPPTPIAKTTPPPPQPAQAEVQEQQAPAKRAPRKTTRPTAVEIKAPADVIPTEPTLTEPTPTEPTPTEPTATEPTPAQPTPTPSSTTPIPSTPEAEADDMVPQRTEAWAQLVADPGHAPELLALAAVQTIGPRAQQWVRRIRERYPTATDDAIARLAMRQFTRLGNVSGIFGAVAGSYAPIALVGAAALTHAELILHVAAAYGHDPAAEERAVDLLVLTRVHPDRPAGEAALAAAKQPAYSDDAKLSDAVWRFGRMAMAQAGSWTAIRLINRFFPGTSLLAATLTSRSSAETVAARARALYSQDSQALGSRV